jgi:alpha-L-rhamnosidase
MKPRLAGGVFLNVAFLALNLLDLDLIAAGVWIPRPDGVQRGSKASVWPTDLRCEYLVNPLGLDVRQPRLSWKLLARDARARGQAQKAYEILVASTLDALARNKGDLWDSGTVKTDQSQLIPYGGKPLRSGMDCFWKVQVRDEQGYLSAWSEPGRWSMGLLDPTDWKAKWIGTDLEFVRRQGWPPPDNTMPDPWFRKTVTLAEAPRRAVIYVASIGYHELYVNGRRVGDAVLSPCVSDHNKRARYVTYEITDFLRQGENVLGLWLGTSWSIFPHYKARGKPASPIVIAQADIELADGQALRVVTDETWKTHPSPNTLVGVWDFMHFGGELYDARQELLDWAEVGFDDSRWKAASVFTPEVVLSAQKVEPNRLVKEIRPVGLIELGAGVYRADMGVNFAGWIEVKVAGEPGDKIEFKLSERLEEPMTHRLRSFYIIGPSGRGTFRNRFNYGVGRWVQIEGLRQKPSLSDIRGWLVRTDYGRTTQFECSDKLLNRIYETTLWTFENLSLGGYMVDCPQRERMGYGGDAHATTETGLDNYSLGAFYTKWAEDWRDVQGRAAAWGTQPKDREAGPAQKVEEGNLPYTAPTYWGGGGPAWSGYCVTLPWEFYRRYGDRRLLEQSFPTIERWLAFLETKARDNLLVRWGGEWDFLGDWLWPGAEGVNGDTRETLFFNNCYWIYNLQTAARIAEVLGKKAQAADWQARAAAVRWAVHRAFFLPDQASYVNGFQAYLSAALIAGVPPADMRPWVWARFEDEVRVRRKGHFWGGITGGYFIIKNLLTAERPDLMYLMASKDDYPSWGDMLKRGATTLWEDWEGKLSLCHSSYLHIGAWFIEGLAGIRPGENGHGFKHLVIRPGLWEGSPLEWVRCQYDSPYGRIESHWRREGAKLLLEVAVPPNTTGTVLLPAGMAKSLTESGKPLGRVAGVRRLGNQDGLIVLRVQPGRYSLVME